MNWLSFYAHLLPSILYLLCNFPETESGRVKRFASNNEEIYDNNFVSVPLDYGLNEEVENIGNETSGEVNENDATANNKQIQIIRKSNDKVTKVGDSVTLTCQSNIPWYVCGWQQPNGQWCDRLSSSIYDTHCHNNPNIQYFKSSLTKVQPNDCSITINDAQGQDTGLWRCHVKHDIRSDLFSEAFINLDVAAPYRLSIAVPSNVKFDQVVDLTPSGAYNNTAEEGTEAKEYDSGYISHKASCSATSVDTHGGGIEPQLTWFVNGIQLRNMSSKIVEKLKKVSSNGKMISSNLRLSPNTMFKDDGPFNITPVVKVDQCIEFYTDSSDCIKSNGTLEYSFRLRCLARQIFPNGTVISESSQVKDLTVERLVDNITEDMKPMTEHQTGKTNVGASVITALIVILILVAIGIVCYAQRFKKWCYADNTRRTTANTFSEPEVEITYSIDHSEDGQEGNEVVRENHGTLPNVSYYNASAATYGNNDVPSLAHDGAFQTTETSRLITSGQDPTSDDNDNRIESYELQTMANDSAVLPDDSSVEISPSDLNSSTLPASTLNGNFPIETPITENVSGTPQLTSNISNGVVGNSFTNGELDAIESIDTEPEVDTNVVGFVLENVTGNKVELRNNKSGTIPDEKYLSLIESSPHTIELQLSPSVVTNGMNQNGERHSTQPTLNNKPKFLSEARQSLTDLISPAPEFSETLSTPRKPNLRKENDYVKFKPPQPSPSTTSIGSVRETPL